MSLQKLKKKNISYNSHWQGKHLSVSLHFEDIISVLSKWRTDGQMFILCNFPAGFLKQKAVPGSFIMKGKEAFRKKDLNRDFTDSIY